MRVKFSVATAVLLLTISSAFGQSSEFAAEGFDTMRIENEIKLAIPGEIVDQVWDYLQTRYDNDNLYLKKFDPAFSTKIDIDEFVDQYYDNEEMQLLTTQNGVRHRTRKTVSDPTNKKNDRQLLQVKIDSIDGNKLNRAEYKYEIEYYPKPKYPLDVHPFYYNVKRGQREALQQRLAEFDIDGMSLAPTIRIDQTRKRVYVSLAKAAFATLTLDLVTASFDGKTAEMVELELELNEINYTESDAATRARMEEINEDIKNDIMKTFPSIVQDQTPKYNKSFMALGIKDFASRPLFGLTENTLLLIALIVLAITALFLWKAKKT